MRFYIRGSDRSIQTKVTLGDIDINEKHVIFREHIYINTRHIHKYTRFRMSPPER